MPAIKDRMIYLIVCSAKGGDVVAEREVSDMDRATTVKDIASGQFEDVVQVLEINPVERICNDVTESVAWDVSAIWASKGEPLACWQLDFIEQSVGINAAQAFPRAA